MGDRFTFGVTDTGGDILYLYSHWGGDTWDIDLTNALIDASGYLSTPHYGNRIIISRLIGKNWESRSGFGFSINQALDTEYGFIPVVDLRYNTVIIYDYNNGTLGDKLVELSIIDFVANKDISGMIHYARVDLDEAREEEDVTV